MVSGMEGVTWACPCSWWSSGEGQRCRDGAGEAEGGRGGSGMVRGGLSPQLQLAWAQFYLLPARCSTQGPQETFM